MFGIPVDSSMLSSPDDDNEDIELWRGVVLLMDLGVGFVVIQLVCGNGMDVRVYLHIQYGRSDILLWNTSGWDDRNVYWNGEF